MAKYREKKEKARKEKEKKHKEKKDNESKDNESKDRKGTTSSANKNKEHQGVHKGINFDKCVKTSTYEERKTVCKEDFEKEEEIEKCTQNFCEHCCPTKFRTFFIQYYFFKFFWNFI